MKAKQVLFFLFVFCTAQLTGQIAEMYRAKADSCAIAGNNRAADSLYSLAIVLTPQAQDFTSRATLRLTTTPCLACSDLFTAATMGDKNAVKQFRRNCYRKTTARICDANSSSLICVNGKAIMKQKIGNGYFKITQADTSFKTINTYYVSGYDTLRLSADTCVMHDSLRAKMYRYINDNTLLRSGSILPFVIGLYSKPEESSSSVLFTVTLSHTGAVLDAQPASGIRNNQYDDAEILRLLNTMMPLGDLGCKPGAYRYSFVIYFSHQW
jgi:hypothetical protein